MAQLGNSFCQWSVFICTQVRFIVAEMTYDMCAEIDEDPAILHITDTASTVS